MCDFVMIEYLNIVLLISVINFVNLCLFNGYFHTIRESIHSSLTEGSV